MTDVASRTHYEVLGVGVSCSVDELRAAYRNLARRHHPDVAKAVAGPSPMVAINEAWRVLSDEGRRGRYDREIVGRRPPTPTDDGITIVPDGGAAVATPQPAPKTTLSRRRAWAASVQGQIAKLARLAGRSATQTLLIRNPRAPRYVYEAVVDDLVAGLCEDTESRVRAARAAGVAPLDLAVGATLVGIRTLADRLRRNATLGVDEHAVMSAELLDRMWDVLAHELTVQLIGALGGNPHVARALGDVPRFQRSTG